MRCHSQYATNQGLKKKNDVKNLFLLNNLHPSGKRENNVKINIPLNKMQLKYKSKYCKNQFFTEQTASNCQITVNVKFSITMNKLQTKSQRTDQQTRKSSPLRLSSHSCAAEVEQLTDLLRKKRVRHMSIGNNFYINVCLHYTLLFTKTP